MADGIYRSTWGSHPYLCAEEMLHLAADAAVWAVFIGNPLDALFTLLDRDLGVVRTSDAEQVDWVLPEPTGARLAVAVD